MTQYHPCLAGLAAALLIVAAAQAQTVPGQVPQRQPPSAQLPPPTEAPPRSDADKPLSEQLSRSGGVIKPPENVDRNIEAPTPNPGPKSMPVVPPPGSPGGNPDVKPK
jgi:hypothetical protein